MIASPVGRFDVRDYGPMNLTEMDHLIVAK